MLSFKRGYGFYSTNTFEKSLIRRVILRLIPGHAGGNSGKTRGNENIGNHMDTFTQSEYFRH